MYYVGQQVQVFTTLPRVDLQAEPTMALSRTKPDGTVAGVSPLTTDHTPTQWMWSANITADQAGDWLYVFTASGSAIGVVPGQFQVRPVELLVVGLAEVKLHLQITSDASDRELLGFMGAAANKLRGLCGDVLPEIVGPEEHRGQRHRVVLERTPIVSVTSVQEYQGGVLIRTLATNEYNVDLESGVLERVAGGYWAAFGADRVRVLYVAGRTPTPDAAREAFKDIVAHNWRRTQALRGGRRPSAENEPAVPIGVGIPSAVMENLKAAQLLAPPILL